MWIERIVLHGFGNLLNQQIEFSRDKLNLVVESNEYGKSTLAEVIWAVLFDYPSDRTTLDKLSSREAKQPVQGGLFKACLDIVANERPLRIVRDFAAKTVRVFDRSRADFEITSEFLQGPTQDDVGLKLTGMNRDLFRSTCFVGQRELEKNTLRECGDLSSFLQSLADTSGGATTSAAAISALESTLARFPYQGIKIRVDKLLQQLEIEQVGLRENLSKLTAEKESVREAFDQLAGLESQIQILEGQLQAADYFQLCLQAADIDSRLMKAQERASRLDELKAQQAKFSEYQYFPAELSPKVEDLWTKRQARLSDYKRKQLELSLREKQLEAKRIEVSEKWPGVSALTAQDAQALAGSAGMLGEVTAELSDSRIKRDSELMRVRKTGVELEQLGGIRTQLLNLDARDLDNANAYNAMISTARDRIRECEGTVWRARQILPEIEEQRKIKLASCRNIFWILGFLVLVFACLVFVLVFFQHQNWNATLVLIAGVMPILGLVVACVFNCIQFGRAKVYRADEADIARKDEEKHSNLGIELHEKIMGLEIRLDDLARKAGIASGVELMKLIQSYGVAASQLKDLDLLDQMIDSREAQSIKLTEQIEPYFTKANRKSDQINAASAYQLSKDINHCLDEARVLEATAGSLELLQEELKYLSGQLNDIESELRTKFRASSLEHDYDLEKGYEEFNRVFKEYRQWQLLGSELARMDDGSLSDLPAADLPAVIQRLESQRNVLLSSIEEIIRTHPEIAQLAPPVMADGGGDSRSQIAQAKLLLDSRRNERDQLTVEIRTATRNYDEKYLSTADEAESLDGEIEQIRRAKTAIELARDTFRHLSDETYMHWSQRLNQITRVMLNSLKTDFESLNFDPELRLTARRKRQSEPLQSAQINSQSSGGTLEQLHLLARMAVARYLSQHNSMPIILDEPFSESDDDRFLSLMKFLLNTILQEHQLILFSCHHKRHDWFMDSLRDEEKDLIRQCRLEQFAQ